ncbi:hypothetical protein F2Q70_00007885 [Brassica cretica]|uniref:Uncharacterized protein n=1 Tax=Brassica cretica TaxID=69181 RepID=A0A8S9LW18_BRACR|nr:hypothetical protein F2Q70_00007885 [Brassica cretica]
MEMKQVIIGGFSAGGGAAAGGGGGGGEAAAASKEEEKKKEESEEEEGDFGFDLFDNKAFIFEIWARVKIFSFITNSSGIKQPGVEANKNCIADEHYLPTFFHMLDPGGISNWSVTYVDWSERRWHPKTHRARDISLKFLKNITSDDVSVHVTSVGKRGEELRWPCTWNGIRRPCYLFARKFHSDSVNKLVRLFPNYTSTVV